MNELETSLDAQLQQIKASCKQMLEQYKVGLRGQLNIAMLDQIAYAEEQMNIGIDYYANEYRKSMQRIALDKKRDNNPMMDRLYNMLAENQKKAFLRGILITKNTWKAHIDRCKANIR